MKKPVTFTIEKDLVEQLKKLSEETMIPQAKLVEKGIKQIIEEYSK